ncbi:MAG: FliA/WhiG family RNA polymerase sigma factor [Dehalococcoidia bacterium]
MTPPVAPSADASEPMSELQRNNALMWESYTSGGDPAVRERLILQYAPLVKYVMGRLAISLPAILDYEDVLSSGTIGLIEAVERFEPSKGVKFETYAISRIRGSIIDTLRALDRLPRSVRQKARVADRAVSKLTLDLGREPSDLEVAEELGLTLEQYLKQIVDVSWVTISLDAMGPGDDDDGPSDISVADPDVEEVTSGLEREEMIGDLAAAIRELPEREQLILSLYYKDELTMREVSRVLDISESRVCQLHARALSRVRASLARRRQEAA